VVSEVQSIELADIDDLAALVDDVRRSGRSRILRRDGEDVAVLMPAGNEANRRSRSTRRAQPTVAEVKRSQAGIKAAIGSWKDVDADTLKDELRSQRNIATRPSVDL
jgi:hypothetical protein